MRFVLPPARQPQSLLVRIAAGVVAVVCLGVLLAIGAVALAVLAVGGIVFAIWFRWRLHRLRKQAAERADDSATHDRTGVIEGEYVVIRERRDGTD